MSKNIVSGAVALLMVFVPASASAIQAYTPTLPSIPQNATIEQLQQLVIELTNFLQYLIALKAQNPGTSPLPTPPLPGYVSISASQNYGTAPLSVTFYIDNAPTGATIDFGDGVTQQVYTNGSSQATAYHTYSRGGGFQVSLRRAASPNEANCSGDCLFLTSTSITVNEPTNSNGAYITFNGVTGANYRIGDTVDWVVNYYNAPSDSNICLLMVSESRVWEAGFNGFGGDGCFVASGNGSRTFPGVLRTTAGFDFTAGRYHLLARLVKSATGNFVPYSTNVTGTFTVLPPIGENPGDIAVRITSPTSGTSYKVGDTIAINYSVSGAPANAQIIVKAENIQASNPPSGNVSGSGWQSPVLTPGNSVGTFPWRTGPSFTDFTGTYRITASMRECDPRGCQWNADFPGQQSNVRTYVTSPDAPTITLNSAVTGSPMGSANVVLSNSPASQTVIAGSDAVVANYIFSASGEDVRISSATLPYTDNMVNDPSSCSLYDGVSRVSSIINPVYTTNGTVGTYTVTFTPGIVISRNTSKTLSMHCLISATSAPGSFKWGLQGNSYFSAQGISSGQAINVLATENFGPTMTVGSSGSFVVSTDASTPSFATVSGGSTNVVMGVYKFRATGESVSLTQLGLKLTSGKPQDIVTVRIYSGATSIGQAVFVGTNSTAVATLYSPFAIQKDSDVTLTIRADVSGIGLGQPGVAGDIIKIDVDSAQTRGTGMNSGTTVTATGGTSVAGVQLGNSTTPSGNPRITLGTISSSYIYVNYYDMPAHTQLGLMNQSTGARVEMPLQVVDYGGTGTWSIPISSNLPSGSYYVRAQNYATGTYISQTVPFTAGTASNPTPSCTISVSPASVTQGQSVTISWTTVNASSATFNGGSVQTNGSQTMTWLAGPGTFNMPLVVTGTGGTATCNAVVNATALTGTLTADIKANNSNGPVSVTSGQNATISWTSTGASMCSIIPSAQTYWAGNFGLTGSKESGALTQTNTYTLTCYGNGNAFVTDTVTVTVAPVVIACPMYAALICPTGQHVVSSPTTKDANNCDVPHNSCVPDQVSCTYTPGSSKYGDKYAPPTASNPSTINIEGGQAACASWCSSKAAEANVNYSCAYNSQTIAIRNGAANERQLASALTAIEGMIKSIIAFFRPAPVPDAALAPTPASGSPSGSENWGPTATKKAQPVDASPAPSTVQSSGTLKASFKGVAFPDIPNVTRELAQKLCRADAVCTWNNEPITAVPSFGQPGDPTMMFNLPAAGSKQTLASGAGYTFEITDPTLPPGAVAANTYRLYFARYTSKNGPDVIYQGQITSVSRTLSGAVQIKWEGRILRADGITEPLPPGFYFPAAVNGTNALKGGSTGSITVTP